MPGNLVAAEEETRNDRDVVLQTKTIERTREQRKGLNEHSTKNKLRLAPKRGY